MTAEELRRCTPMDYWLSYTLSQTVGALQSVWEPALKNGELAKLSPPQPNT